jgi:hypothetical protein
VVTKFEYVAIAGSTRHEPDVRECRYPLRGLIMAKKATKTKSAAAKKTTKAKKPAAKKKTTAKKKK